MGCGVCFTDILRLGRKQTLLPALRKLHGSFASQQSKHGLSEVVEAAVMNDNSHPLNDSLVSAEDVEFQEGDLLASPWGPVAKQIFDLKNG